MSAVPDRIRYALEVLDPGPADRLLEIGCGPGVAAGLVCERLSSGHLLAIDRSPVAVRRTTGRNAAHVAAGRLAVRMSSLADLDVPTGSLDAAFAVDVNLFWTGDPAAELTVLRRALRGKGAVHLCYRAAGPTSADRVTAAVAAALGAHGFVAVETAVTSTGVSVSARRPRGSDEPAQP